MVTIPRLIATPFSLAIMLGIATVLTAFAADPAPDASAIRYATTTGGVRFGTWGPEASAPAPVLFVFASTIEETLGDPYYRQCGNALADEGYLCVSLDLPCHEESQQSGEPGGLAGWCYRAEHDEDFVTPFCDQAREVLDRLVELGAADPRRVAACGTSRGGYMALQFAARDPRVRCIAAFAPVTDLRALCEFQDVGPNPLVDRLSLVEQACALAGRSVWVVIGDRDARVGTDNAIAFVRAVTAASLEKTGASDATLIVFPEPKGHTTPAGTVELAAQWIQTKMSSEGVDNRQGDSTP